MSTESESCSVVSDSLQPRILQAGILEWIAFPFSRGSFQPRYWTQVSHIAGRFFTSWATREPKNTGVVSLSLLQWIFPIQELNWGLLLCRRFFTNWALGEARSRALGAYIVRILQKAPGTLSALYKYLLLIVHKQVFHRSRLAVETEDVVYPSR